MMLQDTQCEQDILEQAESLASRDQWKEAASLLRDYHEQTTLSLKALGKLAYYYSRAGDYNRAMAVYQDLLQQQPSEARWLYALGFQYQQTKQWLGAIAAYEQSLQLAPRWLLPTLRLGDTYQASGQTDKALETYREGVQIYQKLDVILRGKLAAIYAKLCARAARMLLLKSDRNQDELEEAARLLRESVTVDPNNADHWYWLGDVLLTLHRVVESLDCLQKAAALAPRKEYIHHKIAQAHLRSGNPDQALTAYERIPGHRRGPYILHGMAQCFLAKGEAMEAARKLHEAIDREPRKFYHYWGFALALIALEAKDQAVEALEKANQFFRQEYGKDYRKALAKVQEVQATLPSGKRISFDVFSSAPGMLSTGTVIKYDASRGFGFMKDDTDDARVFFHISSVKGRTAPKIGMQAKYLRKVGEKGIQAGKVWLVSN
jgi:tetratricopeptide (TPR) repeat protein/cold shock CspA family protein